MTGLAPGDVFAGDFRIVSLLAQGGMGAVYVVEQLSTNKRRALKLMLDARSADAELRTRFEQEAKVGSLIASEHVVDVIAAGVDAVTGAPWLAMELLEGVDLATHAEGRAPLPPGEVADIFAQLCHALGAAHRIPVVHRDLKPQNIFLARPRLADARSIVKVLDFGIAKVVSEGAAKSTKAMGTPLWMAPEQTDTKAVISPATDVWALGLIAFHLLTGKIFWKSGNVASAQGPALLREVVLDPIPKASVRLAELGGRVVLPDGFDAWFARACARKPQERFPNAVEAWSALAPVLGARPSLALAATVPVVPATPARIAGLSSTIEAPALAQTATLDAIGRTLPFGPPAARPPSPWRNATIVMLCSLAVLAASIIFAVRRGSLGGSARSTTSEPTATVTNEPFSDAAVENDPSAGTGAPSAAASIATAEPNLAIDVDAAVVLSVTDLPSASAPVPSAAPPRSSPRGRGTRPAAPRETPPAPAPSLISTGVNRPDHI